MNPLQATVVTALGDYPWSSYRCFIGQEVKLPDWLFREAIYGQMGVKRKLGKAYQAFVEDCEVDEDIVSFYQRERIGPILGTEDFRQGLRLGQYEAINEVNYADKQCVRPSMEAIIGAVSSYYCVPAGAVSGTTKGRGYENRPRKVAMYLAHL